MTDLRLKRLLLVAFGMGNCKAFYSQYLKLINMYDPPLVNWMLGHAYLTPEGVKKLEELK